MKVQKRSLNTYTKVGGRIFLCLALEENVGASNLFLEGKKHANTRPFLKAVISADYVMAYVMAALMMVCRGCGVRMFSLFACVSLPSFPLVSMATKRNRCTWHRASVYDSSDHSYTVLSVPIK